MKLRVHMRMAAVGAMIVVFLFPILLGTFAVPAGLVEAQEVGGAGGAKTGVLANPLKFKTITEFFLATIDVILILLLPIIVLMIIYSGFLFVTASGNSEKISVAKRALLYAIIGGVLVLGARVILDVIANTVNSIK